MAIGEIERYREVTLLNSEGSYYLLTSTVGKKATFRPGTFPIIIKGFTVQHLTTLAFTVSLPVAFYKNSSPGLSATGNYTLIDTITLATGGGSDTGQVFYSSPNPAVGSTSNMILLPGEELVAHLLTSTSTASEAHALGATMYYEPYYQNPGENSSMTAA